MQIARKIYVMGNVRNIFFEIRNAYYTFCADRQLAIIMTLYADRKED